MTADLVLPTFADVQAAAQRLRPAQDGVCGEQLAEFRYERVVLEHYHAG